MYKLSELTSKEVKEAARSFGADLVGIGSVYRWKNVPPSQNPKSILPTAKSVICIGLRINRGTLRAIENGNYYSAYTLAGFNDLNKVIAPMVQNRVTNFLEDYGYESIPVMYYAHNLTGNRGTVPDKNRSSGKPKADIFFDFRLGGVLCGVGEMGYSRVLLTPEFGPAQRLYFILTEAGLQQDDLIEGICDSCMECVRNCPADALSSKNQEIFFLNEETEIKRSEINTVKCRIAHVSGGLSHFADNETKEHALKIIKDYDELNIDGNFIPSEREIKENITDKVSYAKNAQNLFGSPAALCGDGCIRACLAHLDKTGKLKNRFPHSFHHIPKNEGL